MMDEPDNVVLAQLRREMADVHVILAEPSVRFDRIERDLG